MRSTLILARRTAVVSRWMYRTGRPNLLAAVVNRALAMLGVARLVPGRLATLQVRGRRTGRSISFPVVVADHEGERYVVAMLGENTNWVANVRAAGGCAILHHAGHEDVRLVEVEPGRRAPILRSYLRVAWGARAHMPIDRRSNLAAFERIADRYPVFRIDSQPFAG